MFLKEKIKIEFNQVYRTFRYHLFFWIASLAFYVFITGNKKLFINYFNLLSVDSIYTNVALVAVAISVLFTFFDSIFSDRVMRFSPIRAIILLRSFLYFGIAFLILYLAGNKSISWEEIKNYKILISKMPKMGIDQIRFLVFFYFTCIINNTYKNVVKKIGIGNFFKWFFGSLNKPREEKRIFMFIDMKSSTTIAENLGHQKFSRLVQDVFNDMSMIYNYHGEVYQYLGDGAIVSWGVKNGVKNMNCIRSFFAFTRLIERRKRYYTRRYGDVPKFKAGMHVGDSMVLQVGSIRRDISYNGDVVNTTARIESKCNEYRKDLLISGVLFEYFNDQEKSDFLFKEVDSSAALKGKKKKVEIYFVRPKATTKKK